MKNLPKILVAIPYHRVKDYCLDKVFAAAHALTYPNKEVVMRFDLAEYGGENNVKKQRDFFRRLAISENFDYLFFMGVDTIPPADVLEKMIKTAEANAIKIIGGVYWGRHNAENGNPNKAVAWIHELSQDEQTKVFSTENTLLKVDGMGMDCVLIHREVLEKITWFDWLQNDDDYPFYDKAKALGYDVWLDTGIQCKHYFTEKGYSYLAKVAENDCPVI